MQTLYKAMIAAALAFPLLLAPAASKEASSKFKNSGMSKYMRKNYAGAVSDFDKHLVKNPTDEDIIFLRGLSKSLLKPEDVTGACADFLAVKNSLKDMNVETYCANQPGW
jgi:outer membrane protein assembly factor BamD (BamD/ComL family)